MKLIDYSNIPDPDTVGDWMRRMGDIAKEQIGLKELGLARDIINQRAMKKDGTEKYTLDVEATKILAEKTNAKYTYAGDQGYMPMAVFLFELGLCIYEEFREGNISPAFGRLDFYRQCKARISKDKKIGYYRADSASYESGLTNGLEDDGVRWGITANLDQAVKTIDK